MPHFKTVIEAQAFNSRKRREREIAMSTWPDDKLRVVPIHHQTAVKGRQVLTFRPTEVIDDPGRIAIMDELGIKYRIVSRLRSPKKKKGDDDSPPAAAAAATTSPPPKRPAPAAAKTAPSSETTGDENTNSDNWKPSGDE